MVLAALATLLMAALLIMFSFSRKAVKEEALLDAEQTLEATVQHIDNVLLDVEQATGNIYWKIMSQLNQPEKTKEFCRKLVEISPYITKCDIIWETDSSATAITMPYWTDPQKTDSTNSEAVTKFCLPLYSGQEKAGMMVVEVPLPLLSKIVLESKPSPNSFSTLLGKNGSYIVHPDSKKLNKNVFKLAKKDPDPSVEEAAKAMLSGETGYKYVKLQGEDCYVFYKPFKRAEVPGRAMTDLGWSAGIVYPENDIFGEYNLLLYTVLIIAAIGLCLLLLLCQTFIHRQLLPLRQLSKSAQHISEGCYDEPITIKNQHDEVGRLQYHFQKMQQSLSAHVGELNRLNTALQERSEVLQAAYEQAQGADQMKTNFLYNMSNQMMAPVKGIYTSVKTICEHYNDLTEEDTRQQVDEIQLHGGNITALLNQLIADSEKSK
jgi:methyl-accepting chemotaxis protein/sigma-B regulation protein RsbU (phosphoserine phosphatase)